MGSILRVGIIGAGHIAEKAARTLNLMDSAECLAIGSRSLEKAQAFASGFGIPRAYGSYDELFDDPDIDLVYIAVPHSHHYDVAKRAILKGKPCLVEKAFTANARQARELIDLARERKVFLAEAIWTRYLPAQDMAREILASGAIGKPVTMYGNLSYNVRSAERIVRPDLCGGALLDLGVYCLNFARMFCDSPISSITSHCTKLPTGVDASESIVIEYENGVMATLHASAISQGSNIAVIAGETGYLFFNDINNTTRLAIYRKNHVLEKEFEAPAQLTGFEYEFDACHKALDAGLLEVPQMPHSEILYMMELMDSLRKDWGVVFPMD